MKVFNGSELNLKEIKKSSDNVCEMVFEGECDAGKVEAKINKVYMNSPSIELEQKEGSFESSAFIKFQLLTCNNDEFFEIKFIEDVSTTDAVNSMKHGRLYKSDASGRIVGYGDCWKFAPDSNVLVDYSSKGYSIKEAIEGLKVCDFYNYEQQQYSLYGLPLPMRTVFKNEEVLGTWSLWENSN